MMRTRFAPSLTGYLHLGHVLHMLYVWGIAKEKGAKVIVRIEDHDQGRARPEYEAAILENMEWLGFIPDLGISIAKATSPSDYRQSNCAAHYAAVLQTLGKHGLVYGCECSRKEISEVQPSGAEELCYSGTCAGKGLPLDGNTVRFRTVAGEIIFQDLNRGECRQSPSEQCGDFSLRDRTGQWTYQFCCVCDDIRHGIDLVIRGEDILSSTARQIQLFHALGNPAPTYFHHPLLFEDQGRKLSKRQRSESITQLRESGISSEAVLGRTAYAAGLIDTAIPLSQGAALSLLGFPH